MRRCLQLEAVATRIRTSCHVTFVRTLFFDVLPGGASVGSVNMWVHRGRVCIIIQYMYMNLRCSTYGTTHLSYLLSSLELVHILVVQINNVRFFLIVTRNAPRVMDISAVWKWLNCSCKITRYIPSCQNLAVESTGCTARTRSNGVLNVSSSWCEPNGDPFGSAVRGSNFGSESNFGHATCVLGL